MMNKRDSEGYIILVEDIDRVVADVIRMKSGTSKFRKQYGEKFQKVTRTVATAYAETQDVSFKDKLFSFLGNVAKIAIPAVISRLSGIDLSITKGIGVNLTTLFK